MSFLAHRTPWMWASWLTALAGSFWMDAARAEPLDRNARSGVLVVPAEDELGRASTDELGEYIEQIERHLDWMHRRAEWRKDADTVTAVEAIQKKLAVAKDHHRKLCRLCAEELHDTVMARECCQAVDDVLHEVIDEHLALMRRLRARRTGPPRMRRITVGT